MVVCRRCKNIIPLCADFYRYKSKEGVADYCEECVYGNPHEASRDYYERKELALYLWRLKEGVA